MSLFEQETLSKHTLFLNITFPYIPKFPALLYQSANIRLLVAQLSLFPLQITTAARSLIP
jgi:hypothetical protein